MNIKNFQSRDLEIIGFLNNTASEYPKDKTIVDLFEEQVNKTPDNKAVIYNGQYLSYKDLKEKVDQLALYLRENGVKPNVIVGLLVERSFEMIIGVLAILKAGGAYLPISTTDPKTRVKQLLKDADVQYLLSHKNYSEELKSEVTVFDVEDEKIYQNKVANLEIINHPNDVAYVIYTSGSTGMPKGVMIEHYSIVNRLNWMQKKYNLTSNDIILQKTPYTFDVSVWELLWWCFTGASLCFLPPKVERIPQVIIETIEKNEISIIHFVPSMLNVFLEYIFEHKEVIRISKLRHVFTSGESLSLSHVEKFRKLLYETNSTMLTNLYGPTEATIDVSYFDCFTDTYDQIIPIGKPIDNINLFIIDSNHIVPLETIGELCISGHGLARGYLNRVELTNQKFSNFQFIKNQITYYTGDIASFLPDGNIRYIGRRDQQVKIHGIRIELEEIEVALLKNNKIKNCVVVVKNYSENIKLIVAYIITNNPATSIELKSFLKINLPDHMIPNLFININEIPLTANGKIDKEALPEPKFN